jgi:hypothetical protein
MYDVPPVSSQSTYLMPSSRKEGGQIDERSNGGMWGSVSGFWTNPRLAPGGLPPAEAVGRQAIGRFAARIPGCLVDDGRTVQSGGNPLRRGGNVRSAAIFKSRKNAL